MAKVRQDAMASVRLELFKDRPSHLKPLARFFRADVAGALGGGPLRFNLPNKRPRQADQLLELAEWISGAFPGSEVCLHYSLKYQPKSAAAFVEFCQRARAFRGCTVLLVSGTGRKSGMDACACLEQAAQLCTREALPPIGVAFSPFEPEVEERGRLERKLRTGMVSQVWLQLGSDLDKLQSGIDFLEGSKPPGVQVFGSVFLPSTALLAQQRARPWAGVYLSEEFLNSVEGACRITQDVLRMYSTAGITPLVESKVENKAALSSLLELLAGVGPDKPESQALASQAAEPRQRVFSKLQRKPVAVIDLDPSSTTADGGSKPGLWDALAKVGKQDAVAAAKQQAPEGTGAIGAPVDPQSVGVVWFRHHDLRTHDHQALAEAAQRHKWVLPLYIWSPESDGDATPGGASQIWLRGALASLQEDLKQLGSPLLLMRATSYAMALSTVVSSTKATAVYYSHQYEPWAQELEERVCGHLESIGVATAGFDGYLLYAPGRVRLKQGFQGGHWGTLMPFFRACAALGKPRRPLPPPAALLAPKVDAACKGLALDELGLESGISPGGEDWGASLRSAWPDISESAALAGMRRFVASPGGLQAYEAQRSRADLEVNANSKLSAYIRWGQLSPNDLFWAVADAGFPREVTKTFGRRLFWRDLAYFQLHHFPSMRSKGIRAHYDRMRWRQDPERLRLWQRGRTGYPLVDAGMRELRRTGWMQQNIRMVVASFLTEFLNITWTEGLRWFEDQLVDADLAINSMMWQNAGRSGIDQWNFRISPVSARSQDPTGAYVRRWVPELAKLPTKFLHKPWECPAEVLADSGVRLGDTYPERCIEDLQAAKTEALDATVQMRREVASTWRNTAEGYDVITLRDGLRTPVFTKREYRVSKDGSLLSGDSDEARRRGGSTQRRVRPRKTASSSS